MLQNACVNIGRNNASGEVRFLSQEFRKAKNGVRFLLVDWCRRERMLPVSARQFLCLMIPSLEYSTILFKKYRSRFLMGFRFEKEYRLFYHALNYSCVRMAKDCMMKVSMMYIMYIS